MYVGYLLLAFLIAEASSLKCYKCNSEDDPACSHASGENTTISQCDSGVTECITKIENTITYRDCRSANENNELFEVCKSDLCNSNIFPKDRLQCYQCQGLGCLNVTKEEKPQPCQFYDKSDQCITDVHDERNATRKCESDLNKECSKYCQKCKTNGCNNLPALTEVTCIQCTYIKGVTSNEDPECIRQKEVNGKCQIIGQKECKYNVTLGRTDHCYTYHKYDTTIRDCYKRGPALDPAFVKICSGNKCNDDCIGISCIRCDSSKDPKCKFEPKYMKGEMCAEDVSSCFSCEDIRGRVNRGCGLRESKNSFCYDCHDRDACNNEQIRTCYRCTSTDTNECVKWSNTTGIDFERCNNPTDNCVATVVYGTYTVRGCQSSVTECTHGDPNCKRCDGSVCNAGIVPSDRLMCHQCNSGADCNKDLSGRKGAPCSNFRPDDVCFAYVDSKTGNTVRGCASDREYRECMKANALKANSCKICYDSNCNTWSLK